MIAAETVDPPVELADEISREHRRIVVPGVAPPLPIEQHLRPHLQRPVCAGPADLDVDLDVVEAILLVGDHAEARNTPVAAVPVETVDAVCCVVRIEDPLKLREIGVVVDHRSSMRHLDARPSPFERLACSSRAGTRGAGQPSGSSRCRR